MTFSFVWRRVYGGALRRTRVWQMDLLILWATALPALNKPASFQYQADAAQSAVLP